MKKHKLIEKLHEETKKSKGISLGEASLAIEILEKLHKTAPTVYDRLKGVLP